jgi:hypothetical protein
VRKHPAMLLMAVLVVFLTACGSDDDDSEPTAAPTQPPTTDVEPSVAPTIDSPATPPVIATPGLAGTPVASPEIAASPVVSGTPLATPALASPAPDAAIMPAVTDAATTQHIDGTVSLLGQVNEQFVISDDGCVGLGTYAGVEAGQQVVIEDQYGAIVGVAELAATESRVVCSWTFTLEVPLSDYYTVSLPMVAEHVYTGEEVTRGDGRIDLTLP